MPTQFTRPPADRPMRASLELEQLNDALEAALYRHWLIKIQQLGQSIVSVTVYDEQSAIITTERGAQPAQTIRYAVQTALAMRQAQH